METSLDWLLGLGWIAAILPILLASLPSSRFKSFHQLVMGLAGRGKITQPSSHKFTVPQKFFLHFYVWAVVWTTFLLIIAWHYAYKMAPLGSDSLDYPTAASNLTGGSRKLSAHMSHFLTAKRRYKLFGSDAHMWLSDWVLVIYLGLLVASGGPDFNLWLLLLFVVANLGSAAAETHRWYVQKFEDCPHKRRAIFPFVY